MLTLFFAAQCQSDYAWVPVGRSPDVFGQLRSPTVATTGLLASLCGNPTEQCHHAYSMLSLRHKRSGQRETTTISFLTFVSSVWKAIEGDWLETPPALVSAGQKISLLKTLKL